jgi:hypothetical protein
MSINVLRFVRSDYIRKNSGTITPTDSYFSNIAILLRANPNFTGSATDPIYPYTTSGTYPTAIFHDSTSPTQSVGQYFARYGNAISVAVPYSPYSSAYPSTDGVYIMQGNTGTTTGFYNSTAITTTDSGVQSGTAPTTSEIAAAGSIEGLQHRVQLSSTAKSTAIANGFTVEFWVEIPVGSFSSSTSLIGVSGDITFTLQTNKTITVSWAPYAFSHGPYYDGGDNTAYYIDYYTAVTQTTSTLSAGWHHIAFTCNYQAIIGTNSGSVNLYVDGSRVAQDLNKQIQSTVSGTTTYKTILTSYATYSNRPLVIRSPSNFYCFNASPFPLTGIRIILGNCLSTAANFTPPTQKVTSNTIGWNGSSSAFTYSSCWISHFTTWGNDTKTINYGYKNYKISMSYSVTPTYNSYATPNVVTVSSTIPTVSNSVYSTGAQSISFTGQANGNLGFFRNPYQTSSEGAVDLVGNDFTVNFFMQRTSGTGVDILWSNNNAVSAGTGTITLYITSANALALRVGTSTTTARITTSTISNNVWYYVQLSRSNTTFTLSSVASGGSVTSGTYTTAAIPTQSTTTSTSYNDPTLAFNIGGDSSVTAANAFYGLIADYRLTLGIARGTPSGYPTYFSPTTA